MDSYLFLLWCCSLRNVEGRNPDSMCMHSVNWRTCTVCYTLFMHSLLYMFYAQLAQIIFHHRAGHLISELTTLMNISKQKKQSITDWNCWKMGGPGSKYIIPLLQINKISPKYNKATIRSRMFIFSWSTSEVVN